MSEDLMERVRNSRNSGAVLKLKLSSIRARDKSVVVCVFEGVDDVGPYEAWISRINDSCRYEPLPGSGKDQLLDLIRRLRLDQAGLGSGVYFFVDRDFDDLKGLEPGPEVFCTGCYSVENYLVTEDVLKRLLSDEFRCTADSNDREPALICFRNVRDQFFEVMRNVNMRIFLGTKLGVRGAGVNSAINSYVTISLHEVLARYTLDILCTLVPLDREPTPEEVGHLNPEFEVLLPENRHRGKFIMAFFLKWLDLLAADRNATAPSLFSTRPKIKFSSQKLSLGWLAVRSSIPEGLPEFVRAMRPA